jgi:acylphosphatase
VMAIKDYVFVPANLIVHGLVYDLSNGSIEVVINGYVSCEET